MTPEKAPIPHDEQDLHRFENEGGPVGEVAPQKSLEKDKKRPTSSPQEISRKNTQNLKKNRQLPT